MERLNNKRRAAAQSKRTVIAVFYEDERVNSAVRNLETHGFDEAQIDVREQVDGPGPLQGPEGSTLAAGAASGALTGAIVGGVFGILLGIGLLPRFSAGVVRDIAIGTGVAIVIGALIGGLIGLIAAWRMRKEPVAEPARPGVLITVAAGSRDEEAKSALIESGGDLNPTNAIDASLI